MRVLFLLTILVFPLVAAEASFTLSIAESDQHFFSKEKVERTIIITGNPLKNSEAVLTWETLVPPAVIGRGKKEINLQPSSENRFKVYLKMPEVKRRVKLVWKIQLIVNGKENLKHEAYYSIFPEDIPRNVRNIISKKIVGVIDPKGDIEEVLKYLNVSFNRLNSHLSLETFDGELIIIGPHTMSSWFLQNALLLLEKKVNEGLNVLYFEQQCSHPFLSPIKGIVSKPIPLSSSRIAALGHPVFQEISEGDLSNWRENGLIGYYPYRLPQRNFRALVRTDLPDCMASPLIEVPHGRGEFIFCQLLVLEKFKEEPVARLLFENLIRYAFMKQKSLQPTVIYGEPESEMMKLLDSMKVVGHRNPDRLGDCNLVIICAYRELARFRDKVFQQQFIHFVRKGGTLIIFGFAVENADFFGEIVPGIEWAECIYAPISVDKKSHMLWGIIERDIKQAFSSEHFFAVKSSNKVNMIIEPGIMAKIQYGKGEIILCQIQFGEDAERSHRILSQLLTNLGVKIEENKR